MASYKIISLVTILLEKFNLENLVSMWMDHIK